MEEQCVFCHIASGQIPAKKVYEDDKVTVVLDINPATPGHMLLIPKAHVAVMPQMDDFLVAHVGMVAKQLSQAAIRALKVEGTSIFVANGGIAGQRAPHFMLHIIPRAQGDGIALQVPQGSVQIDAASKAKLKEAIAKLTGTEVAQEPTEEKEPQKPKDKQEEAPKEPKSADKKNDAKAAQKKNLDAITELLTK